MLMVLFEGRNCELRIDSSTSTARQVIRCVYRRASEASFMLIVRDGIGVFRASATRMAPVSPDYSSNGRLMLVYGRADSLVPFALYLVKRRRYPVRGGPLQPRRTRKKATR